jgi:hypothetical protein
VLVGESYPDPQIIIEKINSGDWDENQISAMIEFEKLTTKQRKKWCWSSYIRFRKQNYLEGNLPQSFMDFVRDLFINIVKKPDFDTIENYDKVLRHFFLLIQGMMPTPIHHNGVVASLIQNIAISIVIEDYENTQRLVSELYDYI